MPEGLTTSFTVKPDDGYQINAVSGCNGSLSDDSYTTGPITNDCTVTATFALPDTGLPFPLQHLINTSGIISAPDALSNPRNDNDGRYVVSWGASRTSGATYVLEEATNRSFTRNKRTVYSGKETSIRLKYRNTDTTYYYRVKAINSYGTESGWVVGTKGTAVSRSSSQVPLQSSAAVLPQAPALTVSLANQIVSLAWNAVSGAEGYRLYYAPYPYAGEHTIQSVEMGGKTEAQYTLPAGTAYYVAVKSYKGSEESSFSNIELTVE